MEAERRDRRPNKVSYVMMSAQPADHLGLPYLLASSPPDRCRVVKDDNVDSGGVCVSFLILHHGLDRSLVRAQTRMADTARDGHDSGDIMGRSRRNSYNFKWTRERKRYNNVRASRSMWATVVRRSASAWIRTRTSVGHSHDIRCIYL